MKYVYLFLLGFLLSCDAGKIRINIPFEDFKEIKLNTSFPDSVAFEYKDTVYIDASHAVLIINGDSTVKRGTIKFYADSSRPVINGDTVYIASTSEIVVSNSVSFFIRARKSVIDVRVGSIRGGEFYNSKVRGLVGCPLKGMKFINSVFTIMLPPHCRMEINPDKGAEIKEMLKLPEFSIYTLKIDSAFVRVENTESK